MQLYWVRVPYTQYVVPSHPFTRQHKSNRTRVTVKEKQKTNEGKLNLIYTIIINIKINDSKHINSVIHEKGATEMMCQTFHLCAKQRRQHQRLKCDYLSKSRRRNAITFRLTL